VKDKAVLEIPGWPVHRRARTSLVYALIAV
jgi:hypothetical protein